MNVQDVMYYYKFKENQQNPIMLFMGYTHSFSIRVSTIISKLLLSDSTNRKQPYSLNNRIEKQRKKLCRMVLRRKQEKHFLKVWAPRALLCYRHESG